MKKIGDYEISVISLISDISVIHSPLRNAEKTDTVGYKVKF